MFESSEPMIAHAVGRLPFISVSVPSAPIVAGVQLCAVSCGTVAAVAFLYCSSSV